jgi:glucokinase
LQVDDSSAIGIGVAIPGRVDFESGVVVSGGYVDLSVVPLQALLLRRFGKPVVLDNDCNMALMGEAAFGAARGLRHVAMLTLGTGIGGALIDKGEIVRGRRCAGQLGHIVIDPFGAPCNCGRRGCIETTSSGTAFARLAAERGLAPGTTLETVIAEADNNDPVAGEVMRAWGVPLCMAVDTIASMLDPEIVLLGGGLGRSGAEVVRRIGRNPSWGDLCPVTSASLGDDAGLVGAALAALQAANCAASGEPRE